MQTTLSPTSLRTFIKGLTCVARYGDELCLHATPETLTLCATNAAKSAYCGMRFAPEFFDTYHVGGPKDPPQMTAESEEEVTVRGQLLAKTYRLTLQIYQPRTAHTTQTLLSILRHKTVEKSLEKCEMSVVEGVEGGVAQNTEESEEQSAESKLVIRLHCKYGVVKTHKLYLNQPPVILAPTLPEQRPSRVLIGPRAMKDLLDHFGRRADAQLQWMFNEDEVRVRSLERDADNQGKHQIATEISVPGEEFDLYEVLYAPIGLAFHLREINASIALAESLSVPIEFSFTEPGGPMTIMLELDAADQLAMVATSTTTGFGPEYDEAIAAAAAKRQRDEEDANNIANEMRSSAASSRAGIMPSAKRRTGKVVEVARAARSYSTLSKGNTSGSGQIAWSTTPSANAGPSGPRGGAQRVQGTPSFVLPPNAQSTQNQAAPQQMDEPSFFLGPNFQSTPHPPPQPQHDQPLMPQGTPSFALPPNAQSTQRPPSPPSFSAAPKAQSTFRPNFQIPSQAAPSQRPPQSSPLFTMPPPPRPLFLPSSQFSQAEVLKEAGLGDLEHMTQKELDAMLEDDDEVPGTPEQGHLSMNELEELFNESDFDATDSQVVGTQGASVAKLGDKTFKPLFDDD